jgi:hypothetical protein
MDELSEDDAREPFEKATEPQLSQHPVQAVGGFVYFFKKQDRML